jgi:2-C-methyl-D-erythritol 2,4-cyclodiphosphate synthase
LKSDEIVAHSTRIGFGYDVHRMSAGRKLVIGGVDIPHPEGLEGHSDADVLLHAVSDALLGAAALGDIGKHFPNSDPRFKGISSLVLLRHVADLLAGHLFAVGNIDATVVLESPQIAPYVDLMRQNIAEALRIPVGQISVKATTHESLGFIGAGDGAAAHAVALITTQ